MQSIDFYKLLPCNRTFVCFRILITRVTLSFQNLANDDGMYDENLHYPLLLQLRKPDNGSEEDSS